MKFIRRLIRNLVILLLAVIIIAGSALAYSGYRCYRNAVTAVSIPEAVAAYADLPGTVTYEQMDEDFVSWRAARNAVESGVSSSKDESSSSSLMSLSSSNVKSSSSVEKSSSSIVESSSSKVLSSSSALVSSSSEILMSNSSEKSSSSLFGESSSSKSLGTMTDSRDGQTYKTVKIDVQIWMAENLNYKADSSFCHHNDESNCSNYGRFYRWATAMDSAGTWSSNGKGCGYGKACSPTYPVRGVCPSGWHLPSLTELITLFNVVEGSSTDYEDAAMFFWSSSENDSIYAYGMNMYYDFGDAYPDVHFKNFGQYVRCLKD